MQNRDSILYLECGTGISGDMTVAALLDLGADQEKLLHVLEGIPGHGFETKISRVKKAGIDCCDFDVILDKEHDGHDHDMDYLYGHLGDGHHEQGHWRCVSLRSWRRRSRRPMAFRWRKCTSMKSARSILLWIL